MADIWNLSDAMAGYFVQPDNFYFCAGYSDFQSEIQVVYSLMNIS